MPRAKKRTGTSVLTRQKLKKSRQRLGAALWRTRVLLVGITVLCAGSFGIYLATRPSPPRASTPEWDITLKSEDDKALSDKAADAVLAAVRKNIGNGTQADLRRAARHAQQTDSYAAVHVMRVGQRGVVVQVRSRVPVLCAEADQLRFIGADGAVYGNPEDPANCPGPVLKGLFGDTRSRFAMRDDVTIALDDSEQVVVREALELIRAAGTQNLKIASLEHRRYRGFFMTITIPPGQDLEVAIGRAPFAATLTKLTGILDKLAEKGEIASRIELDYQGKAFIKSKKM